MYTKRTDSSIPERKIRPGIVRLRPACYNTLRQLHGLFETIQSLNKTMGRRRRKTAPSLRPYAAFFLPGKGTKMNQTAQNHTTILTRAAIIAALYAALTLLLAPMSFGLVQVRVSEALTLLPVLMPEAVPALFVGCLLANFLGGATALDVVFGALATLLAAVCTRLLRRRLLPAMLMPVLFNGAIVGTVVYFAYSPGVPVALCMLSVAAGEAISCCALGPIMLKALERIPQKMLHS